MGNNILNPLEKEMLIKLYHRSPGVKLGEFCHANNISDGAFKSWIKKYEEDGLEGLYRSKRMPELLPEGMDKTAENYKRELIKARLELERLKKNYTRIRSPDGKQKGFVILSDKSTRS
jgi:transposase-like protein